MNGLSFFLGSSDVSALPSINGYFYSPKLYINQGQYFVSETQYTVNVGITLNSNTYLGSEEEVEEHFLTLEPAIDLEADHFNRNLAEGTTELDTVCMGESNENMIWTGEYPFAQEYSFHSWIKADLACDEPMTVFRMVIDVSEEYNAENPLNPNFDAEGNFVPDFSDIGNNLFVGEIVDGKFHAYTYTFGI